MVLETEKTLALLKRLFPFSFLDEQDLSALLPLLEVVVFNQNTVIYSSGDIPDYLYFVLSGEVGLITRELQTEDQEIMVTSGDHFGAEVLSATDYRLNDAVCKSNTRLLRANRQGLEECAKQSPQIRKALKMFLHTDKLRNRLILPWLGKEEKVLLISRRHSLFLLLRILLLGGTALVGSGVLLSLAITPDGVNTGLLVFAVFILLLGAFLSIWAGLEWTNDYFFITADRVLVQKKMVGFFDSRQESPYSALLSTGLDSSIWGRLVGFGNIHLRSYTGDLTFKRLPNPEVIFELLEFQRHRAVRETRQQDREDIRETLQSRLEGKPKRGHKTGADQRPGITTTYAGSSLLNALARFYGLRQVKSGSVIYRTHWWILLGKTLLPTLILIGVVIFVIIKWVGLTPSLTDTEAYGTAIIITLIGWGWWIYQYLDWHNDIYIITSDQLVDVNRKPLGKEERRSAPIKNIQTVQFKRKGIIGLVLNFGTVRIQIGNEELTFDNVYDPASIQAEVFAYFKRFNQRSQELEQEKLADWIKTYDEIRNGKRDASGNAKKNG